MLVQPMVMTGGGPSNSTYTVVYDIYETGTVNWEIGTGIYNGYCIRILCNDTDRDPDNRNKR